MTIGNSGNVSGIESRLTNSLGREAYPKNSGCQRLLKLWRVPREVIGSKTRVRDPLPFVFTYMKRARQQA